MIKFASICPHPPIIIPTIGSFSDLKKVKKTIKALEKLASLFSKKEIETVVIISPHGAVDYSHFNFNLSPTFWGNFSNFGDFKTHFKFKNDLNFLKKLIKECRKEKIPYKKIKYQLLDHGVLVPLYYLFRNLKKFPKIVPLAYTFLNPEIHFKFGQIIYKISQTAEKKIALIASGDLSHRLTPFAPAGYSPNGKIFDEKILKLLEKNDIKGILKIDPYLREDAGECGYLSIVILLGTISKIKKAKFKILSYEAPFGVGYLTANLLGL